MILKGEGFKNIDFNFNGFFYWEMKRVLKIGEE